MAASQDPYFPLSRSIAELVSSGPESETMALKYSRDGTMVVSSNSGVLEAYSSLTLWAVGGDPSTWQLLATAQVGSTINAVDFSPDGSSVVAGDVMGNLTVWSVGRDPYTLRLLRSVGATKSSFTSVEFSPDGSLLVAGDSSCNLTLWEVSGHPSTWGLVSSIQGRCYKPSVNFSPDGAMVVSGGGGYQFGVDVDLTLWAVGAGQATWQLLRQLGDSSTTRIQCVNFAPDGSRVVSGHSNGDLNLWAVAGNSSTWQRLKLVGNSGSTIRSVNFSPDGSTILSGDERSLKLWAVSGDASTWRLLQRLSGSPFGVTSVNFSPDGSKFVYGSLSLDGLSLNGWALGGDPSTRQLLATAQVGSGISMNAVDFSPDGSRIVVGARALSMWAVGREPSTLSSLEQLGSSSSYSAVDFSPGGSQLVAGAYGTLTLWAVADDRSTSQLLASVQVGYIIRSVNFSPDGSKVVSGGDRLGNNTGYLTVWAVSRGPPTWQLLPLFGPTVEATIYRVSFSPSGSWLVSGGMSANLNVWEASTWQLVRQLRTGLKFVSSLSFSPDGSRLVCGGMSSDLRGKLSLWEVSTWQRLAVLGVSAVIHSVNFSPDGTRLVSAGEKGSLILWAVVRNAATLPLQLLKQLGSTNSTIQAATFSPDGSRVVSGDMNGNLNLWAVTGDPTTSQRQANSTWITSPKAAWMLVVNQYPNTSKELAQLAPCGPEIYAGGPYEVCNMTITQPSSSYLRRSGSPGVDDLLLLWLPAMRLNFTGSDLRALSARDLPIPWRSISLWLQNTGFPSSATELFRFLIESSPFVEELDISFTFVAGPIATRPPLLKKLQAAGSPITSVSADFFTPFVELLDLRNTSYLQDANGGSLNQYVFRRGIPSCSETLPGHVIDGLLCKMCQRQPDQTMWYYDPQPSSQQCAPCSSSSSPKELLVPVAVLFVLVLVLAPLAYRLKARIKGLRDRIQGLLPRVQFLSEKATMTLFAYQQLSQLGYMSSPLPPSIQALANAVDISNLDWFSHPAFYSCTLGLNYHAAWLLGLLQVTALLALVLLLGRAFRIPLRESFTFAHELTIMTVAAKTLPLLDCDSRLVTSILPLPKAIRTPYLRVDYGINCRDPVHILFAVLGVLVLTVYCFLIPGLQTFRLFRARFVINPPPLQGQPTSHLTPQHYLEITRSELSRLDEAQLYPSEGFDHARLVEVETIKVRARLLKNDPQFHKEVEMVSNYVPSKWWWFPVPTMSRVLLAGIYVCPQGQQVFLGCALCMVVSLAVLYFRPNLRQTDNQHEMLCQAAVSLTFALNSVQPANPGPWWLTVVIGIVMMLPALNLLYHLVQHFNPTHKARRQLEELITVASEEASSVVSEEAVIELQTRSPEESTSNSQTAAEESTNPPQSPV